MRKISIIAIMVAFTFVAFAGALLFGEITGAENNPGDITNQNVQNSLFALTSSLQVGDIIRIWNNDTHTKQDYVYDGNGFTESGETEPYTGPDGGSGGGGDGGSNGGGGGYGGGGGGPIAGGCHGHCPNGIGEVLPLIPV